jgi:hypothetical protein
VTFLRARLSAVRRSCDAGASLALALVFVMAFGLYVGTVLQFATTSQQTAVSVRDEATNTYAAGAALDGAINTIRGDLTAGVDPGGATPPPSSTCFTLPAGEVDNASAIAVTCEPRTGSGANTALASAPQHAVLALATDPAEGVVVPPWFNVVPVKGPIASNERVEVGFLSSLTSTASIAASSCVISGWTYVDPAPDCNAPATADPGWSGAPTTYPPMVANLPTGCSTPLIALNPGTYLSRQGLQNLLDCTNTVVWFRPGTYYFDFRDGSGGHELAVTNAVVIGGTPSGWTPGSTGAGSVPAPTAANPNRSACDSSAPGVDFVFGNDSSLAVSSAGRLQLCAAETGTSQQHVVLRGLANQLGPLTAAQPSGGTATAATNNGSGPQWTNAGSGAAINGTSATINIGGGATSRNLRIGPFTSGLVPPEASSISVTVNLRGQVNGRATETVRLLSGSTTLASAVIRACASGCSDSGLRTDSVTMPVTGAGAATAVNSLSVDVVVSGGGGSGANVSVDGVTVDVSFSAPLRATANGTTLFRTAGSANNTTVALHGTVYAPKAAVDLTLDNVPYVVVDRGMVVRHAQLAMSTANGYDGPLISVPDPVQSPRRVLLTARDSSGAWMGRAYVMISDGSGQNGTVPRVTEWSVG